MFPMFALTTTIQPTCVPASFEALSHAKSNIARLFPCAGVSSAVFQHRLHQLFVLSVILKGLHALIELIGGITLYLFSTDVIVAWLWEAGRSNDWVARFAHSFSKPEHEFYAFYLVSHGIVNGAIVAGLLLRKRWSYHATFVVLTLFIAYQLYRYSYTH